MNIEDSIPAPAELPLQRPVPLVRLELVLPFIEELDRSGVDASPVLGRHGISRSSVADSNLFISVNIVHQLLEDIAAAADDPYIGGKVGECLNLAAWSPLADAAAHADTLAEFLARFIMAVSDDASSAVHTLEVGQRFSFFRERRVAEPDIAPSQNDAFTAAFVLSILHRAVGKHWQPKKVLLQVCDPAALPPGFQSIHIVGGNKLGMSIRFPSQWLTYTINRAGFMQTATQSIAKKAPPDSFLEALRLTLAPRLSEINLGVDQIAQLFSISRQSLQRRLKASGTSLTLEIAKLKKLRAIEELTHTDKQVAAIGEALGFENPASFTRAFKSWTGKSPRNYRKNQSRTHQ